MYSFCNIVLQTDQIYENLKTMAGHSKFKNIMHRKGAQDKKRAKIFGRLIKELTVAARSSTDPDSNPRLRTALAAARAANMPKDNIERVLKRAEGGEGEGEGEGKHAVSLDVLVASWPRGRFCWWGARRNSKESPKALSTEGASWSWGFSGWRMQSCNCRNQAGR